MARQQPRVKLSPIAKQFYELYVRFSENLHNGWVHYESQKEIIAVLNGQCLDNAYADAFKITTVSPVNSERRAITRLTGHNLLKMTERFFHRELPEELFVNAIGRFEAFVSDVAECAYLNQPIRFLRVDVPGTPTIATNPSNHKLLRKLIAGDSMADTLRVFEEDCLQQPNPKGVEITFRNMDEKMAKHIRLSTTSEEAIQRFVEEKLRGIFYGDPVKIFRANKLRLDPTLAIKATCASELVFYQEMVGRRNVLIHNLGRIDHKYLRENPSPQYALGDRVYIDEEYLMNAFSSMNILAKAYVNEAAIAITGASLPTVRM